METFYRRTLVFLKSYIRNRSKNRNERGENIKDRMSILIKGKIIEEGIFDLNNETRSLNSRYNIIKMIIS